MGREAAPREVLEEIVLVPEPGGEPRHRLPQARIELA
jgi:hypothetical protein